MSRTVLAMTMGDPAGIGPEVCLKSMQSLKSKDVAIVLFGDADVCHKLCLASGLSMPPVVDSLQSAIAMLESDSFSTTNANVVLHIESLGGDWKPRIVSSATGAASYRYITEAIDAGMRGAVDGVVTGPIHKEALRLSGVQFPGHTEIFEALTKSQRACMMLTSNALTCSFVTTHIGLCDVPRAISIVRTSVDHGTALDIAWQDFNADPTSMLQAIHLAAKLSSKHVSETP